MVGETSYFLCKSASEWRADLRCKSEKSMSLSGNPFVAPMPIECPVCQGRDMVAFARMGDRLFGVADGMFDLFRCSGCGCTYQHPMPSAETVASFYPRGYWWSGDKEARPKSIQAVAALERIYRETVAGDHVRFLSRCARTSQSGGRALLDIGCSSGLFLSLARRKGYSCTGMDIAPEAVAAARAQYGLEVLVGRAGDRIWGDRRFDFITMFHVLEHLSDPLSALLYAKDLLRPGGSLILQVPNIESWQSRIFGARWYGLDVPRHLINFTPAAFAILMKNAGLKQVEQARFSLRDNPASIASSMAPALDPISRACRQGAMGYSRMAKEVAYFFLVLASLPLAAVESGFGAGGTIWVCARRSDS
jgi:2-polyprenyl-3-methyl-5-hydroxy-6-metoxy-1,4-benzoquinol methylase